MMQIDSVQLRHDGILIVVGTKEVDGRPMGFVRLVGENEPDYRDLVGLLPPSPAPAG